MIPKMPNPGALTEIIREYLFPQGCALCGKIFANHSIDSCYGLCKHCRDSLAIPIAERGRCSRCGQPLISEMSTCLPCRIFSEKEASERSFDRIVSLYPYTGKFQKVLKCYKFKNRLSLGNFFIEKLWQGIAVFEDPDLKEFCWVPVPARPGKIKHKGWDQIDYLTKLFERDIKKKNNIQKNHSREVRKSANSISLQRCLKRLPSESQKKLNRENRLQNLKSKIVFDKAGYSFSGKAESYTVPRIAVLFDDVYTTGSTMDACASALKSAGTEKVYGICLCYD